MPSQIRRPARPIAGLSFLLVLIAMGISARGDDQDHGGTLPPGKFVNPIGEGADPWVIKDPNADRYLWCYSDGNRAIAIHTSDSLTSLGKKHLIWKAPRRGPYSREIWAPELHFLDDRWHVYFAASDGDNVNHKAYVLRSESDDVLGKYELVGPLKTGDGPDRDSPNIWAIDMTVLELGDRRYAVWSGWDAPGTDQQYLYIAAMASPTQLTGPRVRLCNHDDFLWERLEPNPDAKGLNEGPQVFQSGGTTSIVYSCGASWMTTYKLGLLELHGDDPLDPASWKKRPKPVFESTESTYGVGHSCFARSLDGDQWWHVFHAKRDRDPGWRRAIFVQPMEVDPQGYPLLGKPVDAGAVLDRPAGEPADRSNADRSRADDLSSAIDSSDKLSELDRFSYYGHHQYIRTGETEIRLGIAPDDPINEYRSGEKIVFDEIFEKNLQVSVEIDFSGDEQSRDAGILFRCSAASVGYDAQRGYFAGLIPRSSLVILGKTNGNSWQELARANATINVSVPQHLMVQMMGDEISVLLDREPQLKIQDDSYHSGAIGLRVVDSDAIFRSWIVKPL